MGTRIRMYTTRWCGYCVRAKALLESRGLPYEEIMVDDDPNFRRSLHELTGGWTVPQIVIDDEAIGGYTELWALDKRGELDSGTHTGPRSGPSPASPAVSPSRSKD